MRIHCNSNKLDSFRGFRYAVNFLCHYMRLVSDKTSFLKHHLRTPVAMTGDALLSSSAAYVLAIGAEKATATMENA
ncbi:MAG: hypothetical protein GXP18_00940 [Gammaproteobacteria bacterium]|nr:hypothetical protein [Gammaproteobacteria bacterium]